MSYKVAILFKDKKTGLYIKKGKFSKVIGFTNLKVSDRKDPWYSHTFKQIDSIDLTMLDPATNKSLFTSDKKKADYIFHTSWNFPNCITRPDIKNILENTLYRIEHGYNRLMDSYKGNYPTGIPTYKDHNGILTPSRLSSSKYVYGKTKRVIHKIPYTFEVVEVSETGFKKTVRAKKVTFYFDKPLKMQIESAAQHQCRCRICGVRCNHIPYIYVDNKAVCYCCINNMQSKLSVEVNKMEPEWRDEVETEMFAHHLKS